MKSIILGVSIALTALTISAQSADSMQKRLDTEAVKLKAWTQDAAILTAVKAQNDQRLILAEIKTRDEAWIAGKNEALVKQITTGACADRLRQFIGGADVYGEVFVMDNQGALVCANQRTSDYWQGDEAKWIRSFNGGTGAVFIDRPRLDESTKEHLAQISLPIMSGGKAIGAITVGIDIDVK